MPTAHPADPPPSSGSTCLPACLIHTPPPLERPQAERVLAAVDEWHFDAFRLEKATQGHALSCLAFYLLQRGGMVRRFSLNPLLLARCGARPPARPPAGRAGGWSSEWRGLPAGAGDVVGSAVVGSGQWWG